ncbi:quinon protein alcohol dehydrogenase-like superfamily [Dendryphion nanum]|uniref:Quinon protein alcohol dehydrogenase-like superfamily n=1 Tax=Dendryphion nanum TaxID=256645 RepID=A0A9P9CZT0_9PLEO|nr:quinon protein alcohol dehydrogenase-like superfamily [Dendryphion nanum]
MEDIETSHQFKATSHPLSSPTANHIASLSGSRLQIRCIFSLEIVRNIALPSSQDLRTSRLAWSPPSTSIIPNNDTSTPPRRAPAPQSNRILVSDDETTRVYDLRDEKWNAVIRNGSGGMGKTVHVEFGRTESEVLVWSDFTSRVTIWCLRSGRSVEIRDPKFIGRDSKGWGYRPYPPSSPGKGRGSALALLCRTAGQDLLLLLAPKTNTVLKRIDLPTTDACGLKWSLDGRWLALWDSPSTGYNLHIYTADGHLFRTLTREPLPPDESRDWSIEGLGIKSVEWVPGGRWLAIGGWDRRVRILSTQTFAPVVFLDHTASISVPSAPVYVESVDARGYRTYNIATQPFVPPKAAVEKTDSGIKEGISVLAFSPDGTMCATRDDSTPTTVWIWDLVALCPKIILVQYRPVKSLLWHPGMDRLLLVQCVMDAPVVYVWDAGGVFARAESRGEGMEVSTGSASGSWSKKVPEPPAILDLSSSFVLPGISTSTSTSTSSSMPKPPSKISAKWLAPSISTSTSTSTPIKKTRTKKPVLLLSHPSSHILIWPWGKDQILRFADQEGDESDDSLFEILTGKRGTEYREVDEDGVMEGEDGYGDEGEDEEDEEQGFEDTFRGKGGRGLAYIPPNLLLIPGFDRNHSSPFT